jgi:beta-ketodecanoyl-[acyl-carrier-protein] synthase
MAIEIQQALGCSGWGFDMLVACSAATFGIINAANAIRSGTAKTVLVINPEVLSPQVNYKDRDSHFIFGDVATASIIEDSSTATGEHQFKIIAEQPITQFSNNIRSNIGYMNQCSPETANDVDKYFIQQGRKVFKEVLPMVSNLISAQMDKVNLAPKDVKRLYLHQANINMNNFIGKKVLGRDPTSEEAPIILDEYANTSSAGCIIALHKHHDGFESGDKSVLCSFGAGYSACCLILEYV